MDNNICTTYEAAALWELDRSGSGDFSGQILVLDLDRCGAGLCRCQPGQAPVQVWETPGTVSGSFFREAAETLMSGCADQKRGAQALYEAISEADWIHSQKNYLRGGRATNLPLPSLVLDGQVFSMTCSDLDTLFSRTWREPIVHMLSQAKAQLDSEDAWLILPIGHLARLFLAEYVIRQAFLAMPMLPDPRLRTCMAQQDPSRIATLGAELYQAMVSKPQAMACTLWLQVLHRSGEKLTPELLTLSNAGTTFEELENIQYVGPVCVSSQSGLTICADSQVHRLDVPCRILPKKDAFACLEAGVGAQQGNLILSLRDSDGRTAQIPLDMI